MPVLHSSLVPHVPRHPNDLRNVFHPHFGDMQMVVLPADQEYTVELHGTATGTLQLELEEYQGSTTIAERIHTSIPVTPNLASTFTLTHVDAIGAIGIDTDGNGTNDVILTSRTPEQTISDLRVYISSLDILPLAKLVLLTEVRKIEKHLLKGKAAQALRAIRTMKTTVSVDARPKLLTQEQKERILEYLVQCEQMLINLPK